MIENQLMIIPTTAKIYNIKCQKKQRLAEYKTLKRGIDDLPKQMSQYGKTI